MLDEAAKTALRIIKEKRQYLDKIADELITKETIEAEDFEKIFA